MPVMGNIHSLYDISISWCFVNVCAGNFENPGNYPNQLEDVLNYADDTPKSHLELI